MFTITVPKDFGTKKLTWTIVANGENNRIRCPLNLNLQGRFRRSRTWRWAIPRRSLKFTPDGPAVTGPPRGIAAT